MRLSGEIVVGGAVFAPPTTRPSFETAVFAGSKSCPPRSSPSWPEIAEFGTASNSLPTFLVFHPYRYAMTPFFKIKFPYNACSPVCTMAKHCLE